MSDFVTFEIAKKLKEKGFPQRPDYFNYSSYYEWDGLRKIHPLSNASVWFDPNISRDNLYFAPKISQVLKWLRKEKKIHITVLVITDCSKDADNNICEEWTFWSFYVTNLNDGSTVYDDFEKIDYIEYQSYEDAALAGIEYVLDNLI